MTAKALAPKPLNLDHEVAVIAGNICLSRLEVEHYLFGDVDALLRVKTEHLRQRFIDAAKEEIERRGWGQK